MKFKKAQEYILSRLENELDSRLHYHNVLHTYDVLTSALRIAEGEGITDYEKNLLKTAAAYHDSGMLSTYAGHEKAATLITMDVLPGYDFSPEEITRINGMIMATKLPQNPTNLLEQIICDADLDYLGRDDFFMIAHGLQLEWNLLKVNTTTLTEWYKLQLSFVGNHHFWTKTAIATRREKKLENLAQIKEFCGKA